MSSPAFSHKSFNSQLKKYYTFYTGAATMPWFGLPSLPIR